MNIRPLEATSPPPSTVEDARFAHESEEEFARLLDFYGVRWQYEPRTFPLREAGDGRIIEAFSPDFYLVELDLYVELTTLKQGLVTDKHRKLRRMRELYPDVHVKLLYKRDYLSLLSKYGIGAMNGVDQMSVREVLISASQIERRLNELGQQITQDYAGREPLFVGVLKGVTCFMADLMRHVSLPVSVDFMTISSYDGDRSGAVRIVQDLTENIGGRDVLIVEDIIDTGMTLNHLMRQLEAREPASLRVCALLDKRARRLVDVPLDYVGFEVPDEFVVGYGLDYRQRFRNLPFIATVRSDVLQQQHPGE
ncbi:MAG TPA: hypoxanthine phosphoribosyltransferase [Dehalococcoidia bacterium]|nr:hypoxanthine phosphoribosyltransferase [Dehalococcoidia bacterium]